MRAQVALMGAALIAFAVVVPARQSSTFISGTVYTAAKEPAAGAIVSVGPYAAVADSNGRFSLPGYAGEQIVVATLDGRSTSVSVIVTGAEPSFGHELVLSSNLAAPTPPSGIRPLTPEGVALAITWEERGIAGDFSSFERLRSRAGLQNTGRGAAPQFSSGPFVARIVSPFVRALNALAEARRRFEPAPLLSADELNAEAIEIVVGSKDLRSDIISGMVIRRGDSIIRPLRSVAAPVQMTNLMGAARDSKVAAFAFDFEAFEPSEDVTLVFIGEHANFEYTLTARELTLMR